MSVIAKIEKYRLESRVRELHNERKTTMEIAKIVTEELNGKGSISQTAVSRWFRTRKDPTPGKRAELRRLALDMIRILNAFVQKR